MWFYHFGLAGWYPNNFRKTNSFLITNPIFVVWNWFWYENFFKSLSVEIKCLQLLVISNKQVPLLQFGRTTCLSFVFESISTKKWSASRTRKNKMYVWWWWHDVWVEATEVNLFQHQTNQQFIIGFYRLVSTMYAIACHQPGRNESENSADCRNKYRSMFTTLINKSCIVRCNQNFVWYS